ncbi:MAG: TIR domain-containing protein [Bacteroidetes bacterium]|nr:TIR domain-containing protein [Bacteroidota bacterium]
MARKVFFSFHFQEDNWRTGQVRNIGAIEGNKPVHDNEWEQIKKSGNTAIKQWIDEQLFGKSCVVVLIGPQTADRYWVQYEIERGWELGKGVVGIRIHKLLNQFSKSASMGDNPFTGIKVNSRIGKIDLGNFVKIYDSPSHYSSTETYKFIEDNITKWIDEAVFTRKLH